MRRTVPGMGKTAYDEQVIRQFRAGEEPTGMHRDRLVLLTTTGSSTGESRTTPLMFQATDAGILLIGSGNAAPDEPAWVGNARETPRVHVELADEEYDADVRELAGEQREAAWERLVAAFPFFAEHQSKIERTIPLLELTRA